MNNPEIDKCPSCPDERLVRIACAVGWLVCPSCDVMVRQSPQEIEVVLPPPETETA